MADPIEVCSVVNALGHGGAEHLLVDAVTAMDDVSFTVAYFGGDDVLADPLRAAGADVRHLAEAVRFDPRAALALGRLLRTGGFDLVHAHLPYAQTVARVAALTAGDLPVLTTQHNVPAAYHPVVRFTERLTRPLDDVTVAVSESVERAHTGRAHPPGEFGDDWCTIHNGIDVAGFHEAVSGADGAAVRATHGVEAADPLVLNVGRLVPDKDQEALVAALAAADLPDAALLFVGEGPLATDVRAATRRHGVADRVHVVGRVPEVAPYYAAADVFAAASRAEGLPVTLIEAMAAGLPVAATDAPGVREVVVDGETGRLAPVGEPDRLAAALEAVAEEPRRGTYGSAGFERAREHFDVSRMAADYRALYRSLLDRDGEG